MSNIAALSVLHMREAAVIPSVYQIEPLTDPRWPDLLQRHPRASVFHTAAWLDALKQTYGYQPIGFTTAAPQRPLQNALIFCMVDSWLTGRRLVSLPFSDHCEPLVDDPADLDVLLEAAREFGSRKLDYIELRPLNAIDTEAGSFEKSPKFWLHRLDLGPDLDTLYRNLHKSSIQRKIRRAQREGLRIEEGRSVALCEEFYGLQKLTRRRHGLPPQSRTWFRNLISNFGEALKIRVAYKGVDAIAAMLTLRFKDTLVYKYGCSDARFHRMAGVQLLFWTSIREAKESGLKCFDLGRSDEDNPGLITFKDRWGAARSALRYARYSFGRAPLPENNLKKQISEHAFAHAPYWALSAASSFLYKHGESISAHARAETNPGRLHGLESHKPRTRTHRTGRSGARKVGAVVIGGDYQGLGIVRSLGRQGIPVCVVDDERSIARFSRYTTATYHVPSLREPRETVDALLEVGRRNDLHGWVLYPTRDETVAALSQHREELSNVFRVPTSSWHSINWLWDKRKTYQLAQELGIPAPRTCYLRDVTDVDRFDGNFPVALKPAIKEHFIYATKQKAWRANSRAELKELFQEASKLLPADEIMIQDLIPGDGACQYAYCCFFKDGKSLADVVACRRRQHPYEFGRASTYVETVELPLLEEYAKRFLTAIDYYGLVEVEFKRDPRDGEYRLLDVNGRTWGYHTIGRHAGLDFPYLLFADQMRRPVEFAKGKPGVRWIRLLTDLPSGIVGIAQGHIKLGAYARSLFQYDEEAVFSMEDPLPGLAEVALFPYLFVKRGF